MSAYRTSERWGRRLSEHRARAGSWLGGAALAGAVALFLARHVAEHGARAGVKTMLGVPVLLIVDLWMAREWNRLRQVRLTVREHGFLFFDGDALHQVPWGEIRSIEAQYVPGALKRGTDDEANLVMVIVQRLDERVALPSELEGFSAFCAELSGHTDAPWRRALIANLAARG